MVMAFLLSPFLDRDLSIIRAAQVNVPTPTTQTFTRESLMLKVLKVIRVLLSPLWYKTLRH